MDESSTPTAKETEELLDWSVVNVPPPVKPFPAVNVTVESFGVVPELIVCQEPSPLKYLLLSPAAVAGTNPVSEAFVPSLPTNGITSTFLVPPNVTSLPAKRVTVNEPFAV